MRLKKRISNQVIQSCGFLEMTRAVVGCWEIQVTVSSSLLQLVSNTEPPWYTVREVVRPHPEDACKHLHPMDVLDILPPHRSFPPSPVACQLLTSQDPSQVMFTSCLVLSSRDLCILILQQAAFVSEADFLVAWKAPGTCCVNVTGLKPVKAANGQNMESTLPQCGDSMGILEKGWNPINYALPCIVNCRGRQVTDIQLIKVGIQLHLLFLS